MACLGGDCRRTGNCICSDRSAKAIEIRPTSDRNRAGYGSGPFTVIGWGNERTIREA
jgi:hypothetical protein